MHWISRPGSWAQLWVWDLGGWGQGQGTGSASSGLQWMANGHQSETAQKGKTRELPWTKWSRAHSSGREGQGVPLSTPKMFCLLGNKHQRRAQHPLRLVGLLLWTQQA